MTWETTTHVVADGSCVTPCCGGQVLCDNDDLAQWRSDFQAVCQSGVTAKWSLNTDVYTQTQQCAGGITAFVRACPSIVESGELTRCASPLFSAFPEIQWSLFDTVSEDMLTKQGCFFPGSIAEYYCRVWTAFFRIRLCTSKIGQDGKFAVYELALATVNSDPIFLNQFDQVFRLTRPMETITGVQSLLTPPPLPWIAVESNATAPCAWCSPVTATIRID